MPDEDEFDVEVWDTSEMLWIVSVVAIVAVWFIVICILFAVTASA